ncbi:MAG: branched-chain amino acid ABC transporter permease [Candidatus Atribacteria bacterium]|nr:branched-chain amino acid ABC transporter permease [Candidatus Atribacteria bacterium]
MFLLIKNYYKFIILAIAFYVLIEMLNGTIPVLPRILTRYYMQILMFALINIIMTVSLNLINGFTGQFSIGHAGFMCIGAYTSAYFTTILFKASNMAYFPQLVLFIFSLIMGGLIAALAGYLIGLPTLRLKGDYLAIVTLAFGEVVRSIVRATDEIAVFFENIGLVRFSETISQLSGPRGLSSIPALSKFWFVYVTTILSIIVMRNFIYSTHGRACLSIRENELAAETMGVNTTRYKIISFSMSAFFAGVGGGLFAHVLRFIHPDNFSFIKSIDYLIYLYAGGMGSITGSIIAATGLTVLPEFLRVINFQQWRLVVYPLFLVILMLRKPDGIFGNREFSFLIPKRKEDH